MQNTGKISPISSIKTRVLILLLGLTTSAILGVALLATYVTQVTGQQAEEISGQALLSQADNYLQQLTQSSARENDLALEEVRHSTAKLAGYIQAVFENPPAGDQANWWDAASRMTLGEHGQYANSAQDTTSVFVPNTRPLDEAVLRDIELSAYMDTLVISTFQNTPHIEAMYFATPRDMVRYYPNIDLGAVLPPEFQASQRPWFVGSLAENNPSGEPWWTSPYVDATGRGLVTTAAAPLYSSQGELLGVVGLDITLNNLRDNVESARLLTGGYSFLVDGSGHAIALNEQGFRDLVGRQPQESDINFDLTTVTTPFAGVLVDMVAGNSGFTSLQLDGRSLYVAYAPLASTGWSLGSVVEESDVLAALATLQTDLRQNARRLALTRLLPVSVLVFLLVTTLGLVLTNRLVVPLQKLAAQAQRIGAGQWDLELPISSRDEIGVLASAFRSMAEQLHGFFRQLENRVTDRTQDLERRTAQLQVAAEIAREAAAIRDPIALLDHAVNLIRGRFGFYHAGIFLLDERGEFAVLRAATGEAGRQMLERNHKLKVGEVGIVGRVTASGKARIALDVSADESHYKNPLLPETRAEMALPLKVGETIIGALDVQSQQPGAFTDEDVTIMQTLADQLAIALSNARLIQESQESLTQLERLFAGYSQDSWRDLSRSRLTIGYRYDPGGLRSIQRPAPGKQDEPETQPAVVSLPIEVRGQVIAWLDVWPGADGLDYDSVELLKAVAERLSQTMDGARLFETTQQRAENERLVSEITARMRATLDVEAVLQAAARELKQGLNLAEAEIRLGQAPGAIPGNGSKTGPRNNGDKPIDSSPPSAQESA